MVGLSMNVVGDSPADRDEFCARTDHRQQTPRAEDRNDLFQAHTGLTLDDSFLLIKIEEMIQFGADSDIMVIVDRLVTITSAEPPGDQRRLFQLCSQVRFDSWKYGEGFA